jgi:hypothetical protein
VDDAEETRDQGSGESEKQRLRQIGWVCRRIEIVSYGFNAATLTPVIAKSNVRIGLRGDGAQIQGAAPRPLSLISNGLSSASLFLTRIVAMRVSGPVGLKTTEKVAEPFGAIEVTVGAVTMKSAGLLLSA